VISTAAPDRFFAGDLVESPIDFRGAGTRRELLSLGVRRPSEALEHALVHGIVDVVEAERRSDGREAAR